MNHLKNTYSELNQVISDCGFKKNHIAKCLGITTVTLNNKLTYKTPWLASEMLVLKNILNLSDEQIDKFFS